MTRLLSKGLSTLIALAASLLLFYLSGKVPYTGDGSITTRSTVAHNGVVPAHLIQLELEATAAKIAIPFGHRFAGHLAEEAPLSKRDDVTITWAQAMANGAVQIARLTGTRTESTWLSPNDLTDPDGSPDNGLGNGWVITEDSPGIPEDLQAAFEDLEISEDDADNVYRLAKQSRSFANCKHQNLAATNALFADFFNVHHGVIIADSSYSPAYRIDPKNEQQDGNLPPWKERLPKVSRMSDVVWIQWAEIAAAAGASAGNLKYIFRHEIVTPNTRFIMEQAVGSEQVDELDEPWPGREFTTADDQFKALMGTVHGISIVDLLTSHPNELGTKSIEKVNVFSHPDADDKDIYEMLWTLTD